MKAVALGLLLAATGLFLIARAFESGHPWLGYVGAFAEASMVGALADWFAVTALFRRPLGLPIPHTAIIPNRKDDIGRGLGTFVETNFLTAEVVGEKLRATPISARLGAWLALPPNAAKVGDQAGTVVASVVGALRDEEIQDAIEQSISSRLRATPVGPPLGRVLDIAVADDRHQQLLSVVLHRVADVLHDNRGALRARLDQESPWWVPQPLDDRIFAKLFEVMQRLLHEVAENPDHELRVSFDERVNDLAEALKKSPEMQQRAEELKEELLAHPALRSWSGGVWQDLKASLLELSADPESELRQRIESAVLSFGIQLRDDPALQAKVDDWLVSFAVTVVEQSRGEIGDLIATTVERWDPAESTRRIELQVGRDLQFIRINGTVVGGLAGLFIYSVGQLLTH
jgi:uncharacterized membrane-anchored protein YjiN (DUF445 family)